MRTEGRTATALAIIIAATLLLWPAFWNGYPLVFSDTGTYLSQAIEGYVGWDRPVFYSLFLLPLHLTLTTWPVIAAQALLTAHVLHLARRGLLPARSVWNVVPLAAVLSVATPLPWVTSELMPDAFTALLVLVLALLIFCSDRFSAGERVWLSAIGTFMIAVHESHVPLALLLVLTMLPLRRWLGAELSAPLLLWTTAPLVLAAVALISVNLAAFGRASLAPFGNVYLLARVIYDGPGMTALRRDCPASGWRLCGSIDHMPATSDDFLWRDDGPVAHAGGAKLVSGEADAIIGAALLAEPGLELRAFAGNAAQQLGRFATGDGLEPWPMTVAPLIERHFPRLEVAAYAASRQTAGILAVPSLLQTLHTVAALAGIGACCALLLSAPRAHPVAAGLAAAVLLALLVNAAITGGLSGPHDRYQSRIMWLPPLVAVLGCLCPRSRRHEPPAIWTTGIRWWQNKAENTERRGSDAHL